MLRKLECVKGVVINAHTKKMECYIEETKTRGRTTARQGEYIVRFASGEWQVFGGLSYGTCFVNRLTIRKGVATWAADKPRINLGPSAV